MLSRVADSIYWMARYVERAENLARFIDVTLNLMVDAPGAVGTQWQPLVSATGDHEWFAKKYAAATQESVVQFLTFDREYPHSILSCLQRARENARSVRETISSEMWEQINEFYHLVENSSDRPMPLDALHDYYHQIKLASHLFQGVSDGTMSHGEGWHFAQVGRMLERADKTSRILDVKYFILLPKIQDIGSPIDDLQWSAVLRSVSAFEMYRKRFHGVAPNRVVEFLVLDREFPRAILHCVDAAERSLHAIAGSPEGAYRNVAEQRLGQLRSELAYASVDDIIRRGLHEFLDGLQTKLNAAGEAVHESFVALRPAGAA